MIKAILEKIKTYDTIIIHRHLRPDMDAIGSQIGLLEALKGKFPKKKIYAVGDLNEMSYEAYMDDIRDDVFHGALSIIVDVAVSHLVSDARYKLSREVIVIDHHKNDCTIENVAHFYQDTNATSAAMIIAYLTRFWRMKLSQKAATYLYAGMVTDTGRFMYINHETAKYTFEVAAYLQNFKPDIKGIYDYLYTESLSKKKTKLLFADFEITKNHVAYRKNTHDLIIKSGLDIQSVSRGMIGQMAGIKEIPIWVSFTEDIENNKILAEIRSRAIEVVDIAKKYGGGGHALACGASLKDFHEADLMLNDLDERVKENGKNIR